MIAIIRISGAVKLDRPIIQTFDRLRMKRKYSCIVFNPTIEQAGMINKLKDFVAFGEINSETFSKLVEKRGQLADRAKKTDLKKAADEIIKGKKYSEANLKPFFRLHPPRGGIKSKVHFPKGVLGNNKEKINELIMRML